MTNICSVKGSESTGSCDEGSERGARSEERGARSEERGARREERGERREERREERTAPMRPHPFFKKDIVRGLALESCGARPFVLVKDKMKKAVVEKPPSG